MKSAPVRGTRDFLPSEERLRDYMRNVILQTYAEFGFERISTPILEDIDNLEKSDGGENLGLIFKVMKRGDKLERALAENGELADLGLRYDLTLPLSRYYAANRAKLPPVAKCIQIDRVYRAERPQKGRLREFYQCDIDTIGDWTSNAELELIYTAATALGRLGFEGFTVRVNDRRILRAALQRAGFDEDRLDSVCITVDKLDKVGMDGVCAELREKGFAESAIANLEGAINGKPEGEAAEVMLSVIEKSRELAKGAYKIEFDPTLVRGMGYYTGMVFEISADGFAGSVAGGGRYDDMVGSFLGERVPAVGFSIGFERIFAILTDNGFRVPGAMPRVALLFSPEDDILAVFAKADALRGEGCCVSTLPRAKKLGKQISALPDYGFGAFYIFGKSEEVELL